MMFSLIVIISHFPGARMTDLYTEKNRFSGLIIRYTQCLPKITELFGYRIRYTLYYF